MNEGTTEALVRRAMICIEQRRYAEAETSLRQHLTGDPRDGWAYYLLAICQLNQNRNDDAAASIREALAIDGPNAAYLGILAALALDKGDHKEALSIAEQAIAADPDRTEGYIAKGQALLRLKRWSEAEEAIRLALALDSDDAMAGNLLAEALRRQNKDGVTSDHIAGLLQKDPNDAYAHANAGWHELEKGNLDRAAMHFRESLRIDPTFDYARGGMLETFKAKSPPYRLYLKYAFAMAKLQTKFQLLIVVGLFLVMRVVRATFTGNLAPVGTIIVALYIVFCLWSWVANGVGNFFLLLNSFARHALNRLEKIEAVAVGGNVLTGLSLFVLSLFVKSEALYFSAFACVASAFPFSATFSNRHPWGRYAYGIAGAGIFVAGMCAAVVSIGTTGTLLAQGLHHYSSIVALAAIWAGAFGVLRRAG